MEHPAAVDPAAEPAAKRARLSPSSSSFADKHEPKSAPTTAVDAAVAAAPARTERQSSSSSRVIDLTSDADDDKGDSDNDTKSVGPKPAGPQPTRPQFADRKWTDAQGERHRRLEGQRGPVIVVFAVREKNPDWPEELQQAVRVLVKVARGKFKTPDGKDTLSLPETLFMSHMFELYVAAFCHAESLAREACKTAAPGDLAASKASKEMHEHFLMHVNISTRENQEVVARLKFLVDLLYEPLFVIHRHLLDFSLVDERTLTNDESRDTLVLRETKARLDAFWEFHKVTPVMQADESWRLVLFKQMFSAVMWETTLVHVARLRKKEVFDTSPLKEPMELFFAEKLASYASIYGACERPMTQRDWLLSHFASFE